MKYILFKIDGSHEIVKSVTPLEYDAIVGLVGGEFEFVTEMQEKDVVLVVNKDTFADMQPRNPFFKPETRDFFSGNVLLGKMVEGKFCGFEDDEVTNHIKEPIGYEQTMFKKNRVYTIISIGDSVAHTTRGVIRATGFMYHGSPTFTDNYKGANIRYVVPNIDSNEALLFEGTDLPFTIDGEIDEDSKARINGLINLSGDKEVINEYIIKHNKNPFFSAYDRINIIDGDVETLLYPLAHTHSKVILDKRSAQESR
jgi:hypothetical protein